MAVAFEIQSGHVIPGCLKSCSFFPVKQCLVWFWFGLFLVYQINVSENDECSALAKILKASHQTGRVPRTNKWLIAHTSKPLKPYMALATLLDSSLPGKYAVQNGGIGRNGKSQKARGQCACETYDTENRQNHRI